MMDEREIVARAIVLHAAIGRLGLRVDEGMPIADAVLAALDSEGYEVIRPATKVCPECGGRGCARCDNVGYVLR